MLLDPRDPAAQAFIADHMADSPFDAFEEACIQSGASKCEVCDACFSTDDDLCDGLCEECDAEENYSPIMRAWRR